ncbi:putative tachykinin family protein [Phaeomoniella chlamydospora]|uniref:Putative tachykinin family protein n=1 Tax=Phaeomoniella chlamydospora TaxID=158046 RepID=A0A0G2GT42_PHACM|nr:putative tachykinin family protein [Phaeomoniella chlamydospora]
MSEPETTAAVIPAIIIPYSTDDQPQQLRLDPNDGRNRHGHKSMTTPKKSVTTRPRSKKDALKAIKGKVDYGKAQRLQREGLQGLVTDCSKRLEPFNALPTKLDKPEEALLSFYLFHYPRLQYGFNPALRPHPVHTNFKISLGTPACFHVILARAALTQLNLKTYKSEIEKQSLEEATLRHKVEAIRRVQKLSLEYNRSNTLEMKDHLLASIMSLGNLDRRAGAAASADVHYNAIRRILKSGGGPMNITNPPLRRVSLFFECMYGTGPQSYIWDASDFPRLLADLNVFLKAVWSTANRGRLEDSPDGLPEDRDRKPDLFVEPTSTLYGTLSKLPADIFNLTPHDQLELVWQLTSTLFLASLVVDKIQTISQVRTSMANIHNAVERGPQKLQSSEATTNIMWLLFQGIGSQFSAFHDPEWSSADEREHSQRIVKITGWMFVCKYLSLNMRLKLRIWLLQFLTGSEMTPLETYKPVPPQLSLFDFSYAR